MQKAKNVFKSMLFINYPVLFISMFCICYNYTYMKERGKHNLLLNILVNTILVFNIFNQGLCMHESAYVYFTWDMN